MIFVRATIVTPVRVGIATPQCIEGIRVIGIDHAIIIVVVIATVWGVISVCVIIVVMLWALVATVWGAISVCVHIVVMPVAFVGTITDSVSVRVDRGATANACTVERVAITIAVGGGDTIAVAHTALV